MPDGTIELESLPQPQTRAELVTLLKDHFEYTGDDSLVSIKSFIADNGHDLGDLDIDRVHKATVAPRVVKFAAPAETDEQRALRISGKGMAVNRVTASNVTNKAAPLTPEQHERMSLRKQYDRKAAKGETVFPDADTAELWGASMRWCAMGGQNREGKYKSYSFDNQIVQKAASEGNNITGGAFVPPPELSLALIELREQYGVFEANAKNEVMANDRKGLARNLIDQAVYWNGENQAATQSDPTLDNPTLTANKLLGLSLESFEILNDNAISVADMTARSFARQAAFKIDTAAFLGTGTNVYGGFVGLNTAFLNISVTRTNIAGAYVATGDLWSEVTLADLQYTQALLPAYAQMSAKWYMPSAAYFAMAKRLQLTAGGVTYREISGKMVPELLGAPVAFVQAMSPVGLTGTVYQDNCMAFYGDLSLSSTFGRVRNSLAFDMSDQRYFDVDQVAFRYRERVAILNHDVGGDTSLTPAGVAGPIVALLGKAS